MNTSSPAPKPTKAPRGLAGFLRGFIHAGRGIRMMVGSECNARFHLCATAGVLALGFGVGITRIEWLAICLAIGLVWSTEALNTAIEWLSDRVESEWSEEIRRIKDVAAGGVLCAALAAGAVGLIVFVPYFSKWWQ